MGASSDEPYFDGGPCNENNLLITIFPQSRPQTGFNLLRLFYNSKPFLVLCLFQKFKGSLVLF